MELRRIVMCVATEKGFEVIKSLASLSTTHAFAVCTFRDKNVLDCFADRIEETAQKLGMAIIDIGEWRRRSHEIVLEFVADAIICVGWRYLIAEETRRAVRNNVIVAHDSMLPRFRGFAPLPTAIIVGARETGVTFLQAAEEVDAGPVYWQKRVPIHNSDTIGELIERLVPLYIEGVHLLCNGPLPNPIPQDHSCATYSIWRDDLDYRIDWLASAETVERMVKAVGKPYLGASTTCGGKLIRVLAAHAVEDVTFEIRDPGKVWVVERDGKPIVVCGSGMLKIDAAESDTGEDVFPMRNFRSRFM